MIRRQKFEEKNERIREGFKELRKKSPEQFKTRLKLSWSNWSFGREALSDSAARLEKYGGEFIELHGNHYGPDLGYDLDETLTIPRDHGLRVSGVCGMFSPDHDLASNIDQMWVPMEKIDDVRLGCFQVSIGLSILR
jgi:D-psicose/D-tagatose/L-ribulose 3-epimerase